VSSEEASSVQVVVMSPGLNAASVKATASRGKSSKTLKVSFHAANTGRYKVTARLNGSLVSEENLEILVAPPSLLQQSVKLPSGFSAGSDGFSVDLAPLTDEQGRRFYYEPSDVHCEVTGGPDDPVRRSIVLCGSTCAHRSSDCRTLKRDRACRRTLRATSPSLSIRRCPANTKARQRFLFIMF